MTAHDLYQLFVGEIGIPRREFLYELTFWEARRIMRGYTRRVCQQWNMTRWQTYLMMSSFCGGKSMREAGIFSAKDLLELPTDNKESAPKISQEDINELQAEIDAINKQNG